MPMHRAGRLSQDQGIAGLTDTSDRRNPYIR